MTANNSCETASTGSLIVVTGSRENAARYIHALLSARDWIVCFGDELSLYGGCQTTAFDGAQDANLCSKALAYALGVLESPNYLRVFLRLPENYILRDLPETISLRMADADAFPPVIGITGKECLQKGTLLATLHARGFRILHSEEILQDLLHRNSPLIEKFYEVDPGLFDDGKCRWEKLNQDKLRMLMNHDPMLRAFLTGAIHAHIRHEIADRIMSGTIPAVIDSPTLFEGKLAQLCSMTATVDPQRERTAFREQCDYVLVKDADFDAFATKCIDFSRSLGIM